LKDTVMNARALFATVALFGLALGFTAPHANAADIDIAARIGFSPGAITILDDRALSAARGAGPGGTLLGALLGATGGIVNGVTAALGGEPGTGGGLIGGLDGVIDALGALGPINIVMAQIGDSTVTHIGIDTQSISLTQGGTTVSLCAGSCGATVSIAQAN